MILTVTLAQLIADSAGAVRAQVISMLPGSKQHLVDDLTQDCLVKIIERAHNFDPEIASFPTWRSHVVRSVVLDDFRKWRFRCSVPPQDFMGRPTDSDPVANVLNAEFEARFTRALRRLTKTRRAVCAALWRGQSAAQVAKRERRVPGNVRFHARRGFRQLGEILIPEAVRRSDELECQEI